MAKKKVTPDFLRKYIQTGEWYEYADLAKLLPLSSTTIVRLLQNTPHTYIKKIVPGSIVKYPRNIRVFPGGALIDAAASYQSSGLDEAEISEYEHRGDVLTETEANPDAE
jgi:hypothetical protein